MAFKFVVLLCVFGAAAAFQQCNLPGTSVSTVVTSTTTTTITSNDDEGAGIVSAGDRGLIRKTWNSARKDGDVAPKILFGFLKSHPEYQKMFKAFADVPQEELLSNGNFLAQAYTILAGLNVVIQSAGSLELLSQQVTALGGAHFERGATPLMFDEFSAIVVQVLAEELGSAFTAEAKSAWTNGLRALTAAISRQLKKKEDLAHPITRLTPRQIADVRRSWETIRSDRNQLVSEVFSRLFKETPRLQRAFAKFGSVPAAELASNAEYNRQVALVADRLDSMIATADDTLQFVGQVNYMGYSHVPRNVGRQHFEDFARVFLDVLSTKGVSSDDLDSWKGTIAVIVSSIDKVQKN